MPTDPDARSTRPARSIEDEHRVQTDLLRTLCEALRSGRDPSEVLELFDQLIEYSEVHFLSEELLMRRRNYPAYDGHVLDHHRTMESMRGIDAEHRAGERAAVLDKAEALLGRIGHHIATQDRQFSQYYDAWRERSETASGQRARTSASD